MNPPRHCLNLACGSARGQVAAVSALLDGHGAYIEQFSVYDDHASDRFFVRSVFSLGDDSTLAGLRSDFAGLAADWGDARCRVHDLAEPTRVLIMVSKFDHCLRELIAQWRRGELTMDIVAVVSNHADLEPLARAEGLPFHHLPVTAGTKPAQEAALLGLIDRYDAEFIVLARYMQVLSQALCERLAGRVINIHHSFLPGFKGGKPYQQAHDRGVKLIGATAHFATSDLDEGPIIEQALEPGLELGAAAREMSDPYLSMSKSHRMPSLLLPSNQPVITVQPRKTPMPIARLFRSSLLAAAMAMAGVPAFSQEAQPVDNTSLTTSDAYAVRASIDKWMEALSARDEKAAGSFVDEGALGIYQGAVADYDRSALLRSLALTFKTQGEKGSWANEIEEIGGSGDIAVVRSKRTLTRSADGGAAGSVTLRLLEVYTRYSDGSWKLSRFVGFPG